MTVQERVDALGYWYHTIDLGSLTTPGWAPMLIDQYMFPDDLTSKRVLDVGAWDGFWTFESLKRGAKEVVAIDNFSDFHVLGVPDDRPKWATFDLCREVLGYSEQQCQRIEMTVYDVLEENLGRFDYVLCYGVLYHCRYPLLAIDHLSSVCDHEIRFESAVCDQFSAHRGGIGHGYGNQRIMEFCPGNSYGQNDTNWWVPTTQTMAEMVQSAGFPEVHGWRMQDPPTALKYARGFVTGRREKSNG